MVQSPSWEANWFAASQEMPSISWNPKVHYRTHKHFHTANSKTVGHFNLHKYIDSVAAVFIEFFHKAASHTLDL